MKRANSRNMSGGFTIIELLVVLGIIAILLAALLPMVSGSRDSALTAKCKNNMHALAQGVVSWASANGEHAHFPAAGFYRELNHKSKKPMYYPHRPWISNKGSVSMLNYSTPSVELGGIAHFTDSENDIRMAITNGAIWQAVNETYDVYRCPAHVNAYEKVNSGRQPGWSYMMNQEFGFNRDGKGCMPFFGSSSHDQLIRVSNSDQGVRDRHTVYRGHDKVLLFAEIQGVDVNTKQGTTLNAVLSGSGIESDAVLEYTKETMGFNHKLGKHKWGGNVAFADGHVDTVVLPTEMNPRELTRYLCQGFDVPHDGRKYTPADIDKK